ncbi:MAG TPA: hypothetical protein VHV10_05020 [Ktedonobacteraceae bacterium]|jgi:hypothetical protein|nr:hypothetical protein [Ktedonobacteraceae bacterium]
MSDNNLIDLLGKEVPKEDLSRYPIWMRQSPATMHFFDIGTDFRATCDEAGESSEFQQIIIEEAEGLFAALSLQERVFQK